MDSKLILAVIGVIATVLGSSEAITCYSCHSYDDSDCYDPLDSDDVDRCQGASCTKSWTTISGVTAVARGCDQTPVTSDECVDVSTSSAQAKACVCRTDYCNDGPAVKPTLYSVIIGATLATIIAWMNKI